ncbi:MAG TPA: hypothetical protein VL624_20305 [Caldimonas sp.]|nr:hypothetical protein [Caldimonas sp.]
MQHDDERQRVAVAAAGNEELERKRSGAASEAALDEAAFAGCGAVFRAGFRDWVVDRIQRFADRAGFHRVVFVGRRHLDGVDVDHVVAVLA